MGKLLQNIKETPEIIILIIICSALYLWHPFFLGFYAEDHNTFLGCISSGFSQAKIYKILSIFFGSRLMAGLLAFLFASLAKDNPFIWHSISIVLVLMTSIVFLFLIRRINDISQYIEKKYVILLVIFWLTFPFNHGFISWPIYLASFMAVPFYLLSFYFLIKDAFVSRKNVIFSSVCFVLSCLCTETFYFQYVVMIAFLIIEKKYFEPVSKKKIVVIFAFFSVIQLILIVGNRLSSAYRKEININLIMNKINYVVSHHSSISQLLIPLITIIMFMSYFIFFFRNVKTKNKNIENVQLFSCVIILSIFLNFIMYFSVGYIIRPFGIASRTTMGFSVLLTFLMLGVAKKLQKYRKFYAIFIVILICCGLIQLKLGQSWVISWELQQEVIKKFPYEKLKSRNLLGNETLLLAIVPTYYRGVNVFGENYSIYPALRNYYGKSTNQFNVVITVFHSNDLYAADYFFMGDKMCEYVIAYKIKNCFNYRNAIVWNFYSGKLYTINGKREIRSYDSLQQNFTNLQEL